MQKEFEKTKKILEKHNQNHILDYYKHLDPSQQKSLLEQISQLDLDQIDKWIKKYIKSDAQIHIPADFEPAPSYPHEPKNDDMMKKYNDAVNLGKKLIADGKIAAFVVAGGQGTRLGFNGPKGNFPASPIKNKTLFQLFAEYILETNRRYNTSCPWYIMTSPLNYQQTKQIFQQNNYYDLDSSDVYIFQQGTNPNFSFDGQILLTQKHQLATSPDGHGGSLKALYKSGATEDMKKRGVEIISYWQVDNPLINIFDPLYIGLHALDNAEMSSKALLKTGPFEKVGNFCLVDGKVTVIEYSDLPDETAQMKKTDDSLLFELGSIGIHIISRTFIEKLNAHGFALPMHKAVKKIPHLDQNGIKVIPTKPNGIKLENFVFDALPLAEQSIILQTCREQEFAPIKNAAGIDSAETSRQMQIERSADWLESAGINIPRKTDGSPDCTIEIAPSFAIYKNDIADKTNQIPKINPKDTLYLE
ncbi:MAG: UDPGP type 1 family protein [Phycisphaerae bacterium]|nr:UDPGP type 1 family protein [Phycisphaerae bacterium]